MSSTVRGGATSAGPAGGDIAVKIGGGMTKPVAAMGVQGVGGTGTMRAYGVAREATATPRAIEYDAFSRVTGGLTAASSADDYARLASALHDNLRLWTTLAADLAGDGNAYPAALRGQLISLARFVQRHSQAVLAQKATVAPLIEINTAVMRGLRGTGGMS
ncbi:MAG: flagellar biosynthesis regulator FlaF [Pseudomonadota bacterium]